MTAFSKELSLAIKIVKEAYKIPEWFKEKGFDFFEKQDSSPVTLADLAAQIFIIDNIKNNFTEDGIIAEEEGSLINKSSENLIENCFNDLGIDVKDLTGTINYKGNSTIRQWSIDPIDGTAGYVEGLSYAVGLGFMLDSDPKISAIAVPNYNKAGLAIFSAEKEQGAKANYGSQGEITIHVSPKDHLQKVNMCRSYHYNRPWVLEFAKNVGILNLIKIDSMLKFCMVADGSADLYIKPLHPDHSYTWDFLPGILMVEEAGGTCTDLDNQTLSFENEKLIWTSPGIVASNGLIHNETINALKNITPS